MTASQRVMRHITIAFFSLAVIAPIVWMIFDDVPSYTVNSVTVDPAVVTAGQSVAIKWDVTVNRSGCSGLFERQVIDSTGVIRSYQTIPGTFELLETGRHKLQNTHPFVIPEMANGPATLRVYISSSCNMWQRFWPVVYVARANFTKVAMAP